jgi:hypothetical protein
MTARYAELLREWTRLRAERRVMRMLDDSPGNVELGKVNAALARLSAEMREELRRPSLEVVA